MPEPASVIYKQTIKEGFTEVVFPLAIKAPIYVVFKNVCVNQ